MTWSYMLSGVLPTTKLSVMIVDTVANTVVSVPRSGWEPSDDHSPHNCRPRADPVPAYDGRPVRFYAQIRPLWKA